MVAEACHSTSVLSAALSNLSKSEVGRPRAIISCVAASRNAESRRCAGTWNRPQLASVAILSTNPCALASSPASTARLKSSRSALQSAARAGLTRGALTNTQPSADARTSVPTRQVIENMPNLQRGRLKHRIAHNFQVVSTITSGIKPCHDEAGMARFDNLWLTDPMAFIGRSGY